MLLHSFFPKPLYENETNRWLKRTYHSAYSLAYLLYQKCSLYTLYLVNFFFFRFCIVLFCYCCCHRRWRLAWDRKSKWAFSLWKVKLTAVIVCCAGLFSFLFVCAYWMTLDLLILLCDQFFFWFCACEVSGRRGQDCAIFLLLANSKTRFISSIIFANVDFLDNRMSTIFEKYKMC